MANAKISALPSASSVSGTDQIPVNQSGTTRRATMTQVSSFVAGATPVGGMLIWLTNSAPSGWLLCYGQAVSRTTYAALFAVIGTTFGVGDGSTTFNLPDLRGRVPLGQDDMGGSSANVVTAAAADTIGSTGGAETHALITAELAAHTHNVSYAGGAGGTGAVYAPGTTLAGTTATSSTGSGTAHNNMQPYITTNYIIYSGV